MPRLVIGSPPRAGDFFGREQLIDRLWRKLETDHVLLQAPRRFGKTAIMYRLHDRPRHGYLPIFLNVEPIESPGDFVVALTAELLHHKRFTKAVRTMWDGVTGIGTFLRNLPESIELGEIKVGLRADTPVAKDWTAHGERLLTMLAKHDPPPLILIDELAIMIKHASRLDEAETVRFLHWFRKLRQTQANKARFVFGSSINLEHTLQERQLIGTINDLYSLRVPPFEPEEADAYVAAIFADRHIEVDVETRARFLELVDPAIPYLLGVLIDAVIERIGRTGESLSPEVVALAFEDDLLAGSAALTFKHYRSRLDEHYSAEQARAAKSMLKLLSINTAPIQTETLFQRYVALTGDARDAEDRFVDLLGMLENDFYILSEGPSCRFYSHVLKRWWKNNYGYLGS